MLKAWGFIKPGSTYFSSPSPDKYHRRYKLNFRIRNGNGCDLIAIPTRNFSFLFQTLTCERNICRINSYAFRISIKFLI